MHKLQNECKHGNRVTGALKNSEHIAHLIDRSRHDKSRWNGFALSKWGGTRKAYSSGGTSAGFSSWMAPVVVVAVVIVVVSGRCGGGGFDVIEERPTDASARALSSSVVPSSASPHVTTAAFAAPMSGTPDDDDWRRDEDDDDDSPSSIVTSPRSCPIVAVETAAALNSFNVGAMVWRFVSLTRHNDVTVREERSMYYLNDIPKVARDGQTNACPPPTSTYTDTHC